MILNKPPYFKYAPSWVLFGCVWLIAKLPYKFIIFLGKGLGQLIKFLIPSRKKVVLTNLELCFKDLTSNDRKKLCDAHFSELGLMITQTFKAFLGNTKKLEQTAIINGREHLDQCIKNKQGVLMVAGHFTALDLGGKILARYYKFAGMYRKHKHPLAEYIVAKSRLNYTDTMFERDELKSIIKYLRAGNILWYAPDQNYRRGQSVFVPFFGNQASTITATHQLARLSKCKVLFFHVKRNTTAPYYTLSISPPLENFPSKDPVEDTKRINQGIEKMVKTSPAEYLWVHKRFKTVEEGKKNPYK